MSSSFVIYGAGGYGDEGVENRFDVIFFAGEIRGKFSTPRYISSFFPFFLPDNEN